MFQPLLTIADNNNGDSIWPFLIFVVIAVIGALSQAIAKARQRRRQQKNAVWKPTTRANEQLSGQRPPTASQKPTTVDDFLEQIRRMAKGEPSPERPPEPRRPEPFLQPVPPPPPRPATPLQAKGAPPPPPRPTRPQQARQPVPSAPPRMDRPPTPRPVEMPARPELRPRARVEPAPSKGPPPGRRAGPRRKPSEELLKPAPKKKPPKPVPAAATLGELRASLTRRLVAGPIAMREAILLGEVLGRPISMRRHHMHRPGPPGRLI